ncbi:MAG: hypothetical protein Q9227_004352 [Pyrenula ochraceoflavens]
MNSPVIFVTGISGYIGGNTIHHLTHSHPEYTITALVRTDEQARAVQDAYPTVKTVLGDLDSHDVLVEQSLKADVVLNLASSDHLPSITSYLTGLRQRPLSSRRYLIHTSGTGILADTSAGSGNATQKIWSDVHDIRAITSFDPATHLHRDVDKAVLEGGAAAGVKTAIVCPPMIHGVGKGPLKKRSIQVPVLIEAVLKRGKGFTVGKGENVWDMVHVDDLAGAYGLLVEEALKADWDRASWGAEGYYFVEGGEFSLMLTLFFSLFPQRWKDVAAAIAEDAMSKGLIKTTDLDELTTDESTRVHPWGPILWGSNCRSRADRLKSSGWRAKAPDVFAEIPGMIDFEIGK